MGCIQVAVAGKLYHADAMLGHMFLKCHFNLILRTNFGILGDFEEPKIK